MRVQAGGGKKRDCRGRAAPERPAGLDSRPSRFLAWGSPEWPVLGRGPFAALRLLHRASWLLPPPPPPARLGSPGPGWVRLSRAAVFGLLGDPLSGGRKGGAARDGQKEPPRLALLLPARIPRESVGPRLGLPLAAASRAVRRGPHGAARGPPRATQRLVPRPGKFCGEETSPRAPLYFRRWRPAWLRTRNSERTSGLALGSPSSVAATPPQVLARKPSKSLPAAAAVAAAEGSRPAGRSSRWGSSNAAPGTAATLK